MNLSLGLATTYIPTQVPPLTPGTNKKMTEALKASFASWEKEQLRLNIVKACPDTVGHGFIETTWEGAPGRGVANLRECRLTTLNARFVPPSAPRAVHPRARDLPLALLCPAPPTQKAEGCPGWRHLEAHPDTCWSSGG
ncbi:Uncharacterized protein GBIM_05629 [Gryllus bimaculatus]|nr:Uncharacterized protein GBIM_05629 [Gryllus bimaculatus]